MDTPEISPSESLAFAADLAREDDLGSVVRAHIWVENILVVLVESSFESPKHLERMSLEFDDYVSLAMATGLPSEWGPCLRSMGTLRNRFAHNLDASLDAAAVSNLYESLPPEGKQQVHSSLTRMRTVDSEGAALPEKYSSLEPKDKFRLIALIIWSRLKAWQIVRGGANGA